MEDQSLVANNGFNTSSHPGDYIGPPEPKRRFVSGETLLHFETSLVGQHPAQPVTPGYYYPVIPRNEARAIVLEDENILLRKKIEELKKQVCFSILILNLRFLQYLFCAFKYKIFQLFSIKNSKSKFKVYIYMYSTLKILDLYQLFI